MKINILSFLSISLVFFTVLFAEEEYDDVKKLITEIIEYQETYINSIENAKKPDDIVTLTKSFENGLAERYKKIKEMDKKHPELGDEKKIPGDLKMLLKKFGYTSRKLGDTIKYILKNNPANQDIRKAYDDLKRITLSIQMIK